MPNPFKAKPGSKKLNQLGSVCPPNQFEIDIEVYSYDGRDPQGPLGPRTAIQGVPINCVGGTPTVPGTTSTGGTWRYQPLNAGNYTCSADFTPQALDERYNHTAYANIPEVVGPNQTAVFLVPTFWVEFIVMDTAAQTLPGINWRLARQPGGGTFANYDTGTTGADGKIDKRDVRRGQHKLIVKELSNAQWAPEAVIGEEIVLSADTAGFEKAEAGNFEILDAKTLAVLQTVAGTVKEVAGTLRLQAKWTPTAGPLAALTHCRIMFRATASGSTAYSTRISLYKPDALNFADSTGRVVNQQVQMKFSDGSTQTVTTAKGKADIKVPWAESVFSVKLLGIADAYVAIDPGVNAGGIAI